MALCTQSNDDLKKPMYVVHAPPLFSAASSAVAAAAAVINVCVDIKTSWILDDDNSVGSFTNVSKGVMNNPRVLLCRLFLSF